MIVMRHIFAVNSKRKALINHLDTLLDERVLLGTSIASQEYLRSVLPNPRVASLILSYPVRKDTFLS